VDNYEETTLDKVVPLVGIHDRSGVKATSVLRGVRSALFYSPNIQAAPSWALFTLISPTQKYFFSSIRAIFIIGEYSEPVRARWIKRRS
jgi:hypothetical protein